MPNDRGNAVPYSPKGGGSERGTSRLDKIKLLTASRFLPPEDYVNCAYFQDIP